MKTPDDIDRKLIALLQDNARLSAVQLSKTVGLSRSAVQERLPLIEAPSCELVVVPGAGHLVEFADVDGFARILEDRILARFGE